MNISKFNVKNLKQEELVLISGGDRITRAVFGFFGRIIGYFAEMNAAEAQHGATGVM